MDEQLLILGNGFDLNVGLKSSFKDYFNQRFQSFREYGDVTSEELINNSEYNIWDIIIRFVRGYSGGVELNNWSDLEKVLFNVMCCTNEYSLNPLLKFNLIDKLIEVQEKRDRQSVAPVWAESDKDDFIFKQIIRKAFIVHYDLFYPIAEGPYSHSDFGNIMATILLKELNKMEEDFSNYLAMQVKSNPKYAMRSEMLLKQLVDASNFEKINILSFNYTNPFEDNNIYNYRLIHGNLIDKNVIFGLDIDSIYQQNMNIDDMFFSQFSKQSRVLGSLFNNKKQNLQNWNFDSKNLSRIIFFGHSLSEADYFYFQALFDSVNLYYSDTKLIFVYSIYDRKKSTEIGTAYKDSIETLLTNYGKSFDNQTHGRNLIQKLLLENRLQIKCLE